MSFNYLESNEKFRKQRQEGVGLGQYLCEIFG